MMNREDGWMQNTATTRTACARHVSRVQRYADMVLHA